MPFSWRGVIGLVWYLTGDNFVSTVGISSFDSDSIELINKSWYFVVLIFDSSIESVNWDILLCLWSDKYR